MKDSFYLISYKYNIGALTIKDMVELVIDGYLTKEEFFDITRYNFDGIIETGGWLR